MDPSCRARSAGTAFNPPAEIVGFYEGTVRVPFFCQHGQETGMGYDGMTMTDFECFSSGYTFAPGGGFPLTTDTMVLADFVRLQSGDAVVDLGSGAGALGLLLCGASPHCQVTGIEIHDLSHQAALENIRRNNLENRMLSIHGDLRQIRALVPAGGFRCAVSNPPYYNGGARSQVHAQARQTDSCTLSNLFEAARWALPTGGDFWLVHKPELLSELMILGRDTGLEVKEVRCVCHREGAQPALVLLRCRRGGKPGVRFWPQLVLRDNAGEFTAEYRRIYHME